MITSVKNDKVKFWKKLHKKKDRIKTKSFLIEGFHLLEEAMNSNWIIREVIVQDDVILPDQVKQLPTIEVSEHVFNGISQTKTPQGIAAVVEIKETQEIEGKFVLLIDAVQDPGNLGTIIRTADALGASGVVLGMDTVDVYNEKVIRATQGSLFHLPIRQNDLQKEITRLQHNDVKVWATALKGAMQFDNLEIPEKTALLIGNEGAGVKEELLEAADEIVNIPISGKAESLNVSVAAGILMYYIKG